LYKINPEHQKLEKKDASFRFVSFRFQKNPSNRLQQQNNKETTNKEQHLKGNT